MLSTYSLLLRSAGPRIPTPVGVSSLLCNKSRPQRHERLAPVSELTSRTDGLGAGGLYLCWNSQRCVRTAASASLQHQTSSSLSRRRPVWSSRPWQMQQHLSLQHQQEPTEFQQQNSFRRSATSSKVLLPHSGHQEPLSASGSQCSFSADCSIIAYSLDDQPRLHNSRPHGM